MRPNSDIYSLASRFRRMRGPVFMAMMMASLLLLGACDTIFTYPDEDAAGEVCVVVDFDIDRNIILEPNIEIPSTMLLHFYDPVSNTMLENKYVPSAGGKIYVRPGNYHLLAYNFGTEATQVREIDHRLSIEAYTNEAPYDLNSRYQAFKSLMKEKKSATRDSEDQPLVNAPDHLWCHLLKDVTISKATSTRGDTLHIKMSPSSIVETYRLEIGAVTGAEYIATANIFITGQIKSEFIGRGATSDIPVTLYSEVYLNKEQTKFITVYRTFGKLPGAEGKIYLNVILKDAAGKDFTYECDLTDILDNPPPSHIIEVELPIVVPKPEGMSSGFKPGVKEWDEEEHDIYL